MSPSPFWTSSKFRLYAQSTECLGWSLVSAHWNSAVKARSSCRAQNSTRRRTRGCGIASPQHVYLSCTLTFKRSITIKISFNTHIILTFKNSTIKKVLIIHTGCLSPYLSGQLDPWFYHYIFKKVKKMNFSIHCKYSSFLNLKTYPSPQFNSYSLCFPKHYRYVPRSSLNCMNHLLELLKSFERIILYKGFKCFLKDSLARIFQTYFKKLFLLSP